MSPPGPRAPRAVAHGGLAPRRLRRHARRGLALAAAVRMVTRVHDDAPDLRPLAHVAGAAGLAEVLVLVIEVADLADGGHAADADPADLARRQADLGVLALLGQELGRGARRADDLAALARDELDVVDRGAERDVRDRQGVADPRLRARRPRRRRRRRAGRGAGACSASRRRGSGAARSAPSGWGRTRPSRCAPARRACRA